MRIIYTKNKLRKRRMKMYPIYKNIGTKENCEVVKVNFPPQHQDCHPGLEYIMNPRPISENVNYKHLIYSFVFPNSTSLSGQLNM